VAETHDGAADGVGQAQIRVFRVDHRHLDPLVQVAQDLQLDEVGLAGAGAGEHDAVVILLGPPVPPGLQAGHAAGYGTAEYNGHPTSLADYIARAGDPSRGDHDRFHGVPQPVYIRDNVYAAGANPFEREQGPVVLGDADVRVTVVDDGDNVYLETRLPQAFDAARVPMITGRDLERVRLVDAEFEERDGSPAVLDTDLVGSRKTHERAHPAGPLAALRSGVFRTPLW
jgi:hypothetical protein